ncbi:MAG: DUF5132 domain-containing protein [bacterium]
MALFEDMFKGLGTGVLLGVGIALAAPVLFPAVGEVVRPLAKSAIKGGLVLGDRIKEMGAEVYEQLCDLTAEAKAERAASAPKQEQPGSQSISISEQPA